MGGVGQEKQRPAPQAAVVDEHDPVDEQRDEEGHAGAGHAECHRLEVMAQHERREADRDEEEQREVGEEGLHERDEHRAPRGDPALREEVHAHGESRQPGARDEVVDRVRDERDPQPLAEAEPASRRLGDPLIGARHGRVGEDRQGDRKKEQGGLDVGGGAEELPAVGEQHEHDEEADPDHHRREEKQPPAADGRLSAPVGQ